MTEKNPTKIFPRTYSSSLKYKLLYLATTLLIFYFLYTFLENVMKFSLSGFVVCIALGFLILSRLNRTFSKVTLYKDRIKVSSLFSTKEIPTSNITGQTQLRSLGSTSQVINYTDDSIDKGLVIPTNFRKDNVWDEWMNQIIDLDEAEDHKFISDLQKNKKLGKSYDQRKLNIDNANKLAIIIKFLIAANIALWIFDISLMLYTAIITQVLAIISLHLYGGNFLVSKRKDPSIVNYIALISSGLLFLNYFDYSHFSGFLIPNSSLIGVTLLGIIIGSPLIYFFIKAYSDIHKLMLTLFIPTIIAAELLFGAAVGMKINTALDSSHPIKHDALVIETIKPNKIILSSWGNEEDQTKITVNRETYKSVWRNKPVCIELHDGLLGVPWYTIKADECL